MMIVGKQILFKWVLSLKIWRTTLDGFIVVKTLFKYKFASHSTQTLCLDQEKIYYFYVSLEKKRLFVMKMTTGFLAYPVYIQSLHE